MPDRPSVVEANVIRVEATRGTDPTTGSKLLTGAAIALGPDGEIDQYGPAGQKYNTLSILNKEWSSGELTGKPTYTELVYWLSSVHTAAVITTPAGGTTSRTWTFTPASAALDNPVTFTVERGPIGGTGEKMSYGLLTDLTLSFSKNDGNDMTGTFLAQRASYGVTVNPSPVAIPLIPIAPTQVDVYIDPTAATIGTTKLLRDFSAEYRLSGKYAPIWPLNSTLNSFDGHTEQKPTAELTLKLGNDTAGQSHLTPMRNGTTQFVRIQATGPIIETTIAYRLRIDLACQVSDAPQVGDEDQLSTLEWTFQIVHDGGWGKSQVVEVINTLTAL